MLGEFVTGLQQACLGMQILQKILGGAVSLVARDSLGVLDDNN